MRGLKVSAPVLRRVNIQDDMARVGLTLAHVRSNDIDRVDMDESLAYRAICSGESPGDWKHCQRGEAGDDRFCKHAFSNLCCHPDAEGILQKKGKWL